MGPQDPRRPEAVPWYRRVGISGLTGIHALPNPPSGPEVGPLEPEVGAHGFGRSLVPFRARYRAHGWSWLVHGTHRHHRNRLRVFEVTLVKFNFRCLFKGSLVEIQDCLNCLLFQFRLVRTFRQILSLVFCWVYSEDRTQFIL